MVLKTFNVEESVYKKFSDLCKSNGMSMSKQVEFFMKSMVEEEPKVKQEYVEKLEKIRKGKFMKVDNFAKKYGL
jgi:antitoxin component of RelBE/YafQ-DinJ toxin-antitoxin module